MTKRFIKDYRGRWKRSRDRYRKDFLRGLTKAKLWANIRKCSECFRPAEMCTKHSKEWDLMFKGTTDGPSKEDRKILNKRYRLKMARIVEKAKWEADYLDRIHNPPRRTWWF